MGIQSRFGLPFAVLIGLTGCGESSADRGAVDTTSTVTAPTSVVTTVGPTPTLAVPAFAATPDELEARIEFFGTTGGNEVGTFAPVQNSRVVGAKADEHAVGYYLDERDQVIATALYVAIPHGQTTFATPTRLLSVVATTPVASEDIDAAIEVYSREVLDDLSTIDSPIKTFEGGPPFFVLTAAVAPTGVLFVIQPPGSPAPPIDELRMRLSTLTA